MLLPVLAIAGLTAWMVLSGASSAKSQSANPSLTAPAPAVAGEKTALRDAAPTPPPDPASPAPPAASADQSAVPAPPVEASPLDGLKISSQSWRRGGLGSRALVTFTLRNNNDYAVKDIEVACAFNRRDGSHLTDRTRLIRDTVDMKSRKTFARMHIGFVNINASQAKCSLVAASRI
ncbi:MAG TPA: hypothetical protein VGY99_28955 [Candidatus Binataceae bacterium]|nr:hypothetical protein [Candidatus Binataceae bacterium]